jgi:hypothetical protein
VSKAPARTTDLAVEQQGEYAVLTFTFPSLRTDGAPLTDLSEIDFYRIENPPSQSEASGGGGAPTDRAPNPEERRKAAAARARERAFLDSATKIATLQITDISARSRGSEVSYQDSLHDFLASPKPPRELGYAVIAVRRAGQRSEISNLATLSPVAPPAAPQDLFATAEADRICLSWIAPDKNVAGNAVEVMGYDVYRRLLDEEDFSKPLNGAPVPEPEFGDTSAAYGNKYVYTVTAVPKDHPKSEGPPAIQFGIDYEDVFPPPAVARLEALPEEHLIRLVWSPVEARDLLGYNLYRQTDGKTMKLTKSPTLETDYTDRDVEVGRTYGYVVRAVDRAGNESPPSPEAQTRLFPEQ